MSNKQPIKISKKKGIPSLNAYFNLKTAKNIVKKIQMLI